MSTTATRLITLVMMLQRHPQQKAAHLASELGVSERTVHRYFNMLEDMGIPIYSERGPNGGFSLMRGYKMPPLVFTPQEATALSLGINLVQEIWGPLYAEAATSAQTKLDNVLPDMQRQEVSWARRSLLARGVRRDVLDPATPRLEHLRRAIREEHCVSIRYRARGQSESEMRVIDPYALIYRWGWQYVLGYCHLRQSPRIFRVDRIEELRALDQHFSKPECFDLEEFLSDDLFPKPGIHATMRFWPRFAFLAWDNRSYWNSIEEESDGSILVSFATPDLTWAASIVMSYGGAAVILEPPELIETVCSWAQELVSQHIVS